MTKPIYSSLLPVNLIGPWHAWFSATAAERFGGGIWLDQQGNEVAVTCVHDKREDGEAGYCWPDKVYRGLVVKRLRDGPPGDYPRVPAPRLDLDYGYMLDSTP